MRKRVRSDDLITIGADKRDSLVSANLSVKYSRSALLYCPQLILSPAGAVTGCGPPEESCRLRRKEEVPGG